jgi:hypothetical protein|tara:strand:- start:4193 stop:5026 length:834 start_codon:yes stop_codon:yes gene_type:complete
MKFKHNKKRNSAFVYEALVREATVAIMKNDSRRQEIALQLLKKHFPQGSTLKKDLDCYRSLYENQQLDRLTCEKILKETKLQKRMIDPNGLFKQQSDLIRDVNRELSPSVFNNFVPNYKTLATIAQIFSDRTSPKNQVILENTIVGNMEDLIPDKIMESPMDNVLYNTFLKKFNAKYNDELLKEQKELLGYYISSFVDNSLQLKMFLNEEIARLKTQLAAANNVDEIKNDEQMLEKTRKVASRLDSYSKATITEEVLMTIMKTQALVKEIYSDANHN